MWELQTTGNGYGIVEINVPLDILQVILETTTGYNLREYASESTKQLSRPLCPYLVLPFVSSDFGTLAFLCPITQGWLPFFSGKLGNLEKSRNSKVIGGFVNENAKSPKSGEFFSVQKKNWHNQGKFVVTQPL